jgi:F-type H+-transporting ATPase subunit delta
MHDTSAIRPYAKAVFASASQHDQLEQWQHYLQVFAEALSEEACRQALQHPALTPAKTADLMRDVLASLGIEDACFQRLMALLAQYRRLSLLPALLLELQILIDQSKNQQHVTIESAFILTAQAKTKLVKWLEQKINKHIVATVEINPNLIGGALVHVGDQVIDLSVRGQLQRLKRQLLHS